MSATWCCDFSAALRTYAHLVAPIVFNDRLVWFLDTGIDMTFTHDYSNTVAIVSKLYQILNAEITT